MTHTEIVKKLVGEIIPSGYAGRDDDRFDNLKAMCTLVQDLIHEIEYVERCKISHEYSVKRSGEYASNFLKEIEQF